MGMVVVVVVVVVVVWVVEKGMMKVMLSVS